MITGFNTDIDHNGRVYHVQTEDKGLDNPQIESLIYSHGEIISARKTSYRELAEADDDSEDTVLRMMETQHKTMIRDIVNGKYDTEGPKPFGHQFITGRSLDEVVLDFLAEHCVPQPLRVEMVDDLILREGTRPTLRLRVIYGADGAAPAAGVTLRVRFVSTIDEPREIFAGVTDDEGYVEASFDLPEMPGADGAIVCEPDGAVRDSGLRRLIEKTRPADSTAEGAQANGRANGRGPSRDPAPAA